MAEIDGTGIPLAYCFVDIFEGNRKGEGNAEPGAVIGILTQFLQPLKDYGLSPAFFGTDKDPAEISAVGQIWPEATRGAPYKTLYLLRKPIIKMNTGP
jgi:hypothetical protein